jgi:hypothetical protein
MIACAELFAYTGEAVVKLGEEVDVTTAIAATKTVGARGGTEDRLPRSLQVVLWTCEN